MRWRPVLVCVALLGASVSAGSGAEAVDPEPPDRVDRIDLYVVLDRSGSMNSEVTTVKNNLAIAIDSLQCPPHGTGDAATCIPDLWAGAGTLGYSGSGAAAFQNWVDVQPNPSFIGLPTTEPSPTSNTQEATNFAAYAAVTGAGGTDFGMASVPARSSCATSPAANASYATFGYPCFREGALPVIVLATDEAPFSGETYHTPDWSTVVKGAMLARGARLLGVYGSGASAATISELTQMATDTGALDAEGTPVVVSGADSNAAAAIEAAVQQLVTGTAPPTVTMTAPAPAFQLSRDAEVAWTATDGNGFGAASHDVRFRRAEPDSAFSEPTYPAQWQGLSAGATSLTRRLAAGSWYCFSARTTDAIGQTSAWSDESCTSRPLDDRSLHRSTEWEKGTGSAYYADTFLKTSRAGARLTLPVTEARQVALVATTCPDCGKVTVTIGTLVVGTVNLKSETRRNRQLLALPAFTSRTGKVKLTVTTSGKPVIVDGLGVGR